MSFANENNQSNDIDGNDCFVNDKKHVNDTVSGASATPIEPLHDPLIKEQNIIVSSPNATNNDELKSETGLVTDSNLNNRTMSIYYGWQAFCLLIIIFTVYETYQNGLPNDPKYYPETKRFFSTKSVVQDYPHGNLISLQKKVSLADVAFVMFYAPWSAESQYARPVYESVAKQFHREIEFSAINCWKPGGECRQQYKKVMAWPVLMAYNRNNVAISYNGLWNEASLSRFVYRMMNPIHRCTQPEDLLQIIHNHDSVAVLFVNMNSSKQFYSIFYQASVKWLETDPAGDMAFVVVTGAARQLFAIDREPVLRLYLWNNTVEYEDTLWKPSLLHKWFAANVHQVSQWLSPPGSKSKEFDSFLKRGPILLLFTPRNLYQTSNDAYAMLRQIGYDYSNCQNDGWLKEMAREYMFNRRKLNLKEYYLRTKECNNVYDWRNNIPNKCAPPDKTTFMSLANSTHFHFNRQQSSGNYCQKPENGVPNEKCIENPQRGKYRISMLDNENDPNSAENIQSVWKAIDCRMNHLSRKIRMDMFFDPLLDKSSSDFDFNKIIGLGCKTNKTLSFLAMDSLTYGLFAERLGISLENSKKSTAAIVIDAQDETSYVLKDPVTTANLIEFVHNFTVQKLDRFLRSDEHSNHSHFHKPVDKHSHKDFHPDAPKYEIVSLTTISSANFTQYIWEKNRLALVAYTSSQCAFCTILTSTLLSVARIFKDANYLKFARIDADKNDLPWHFTMERLPALLIFDGNNQLESRKFSSSMQINVPNVIGFILSNLKQPNRLKAMSTILNIKHQERQSFQSAVIVLQRETDVSISDNLKLWRRHPLKRPYILRRIQALRQLYLELFRQFDKRDLVRLNELIQNVLNVWVFNS